MHIPMSRNGLMTPSSDSNRDTALDIDTGKLKMTVGRFVGIIVSVIGIVVAAVVAIVTFSITTATRADVTKEFKEHKNKLHSIAGEETSMKDMSDEIKDNSTEIEKVGEKVQEVSRQHLYTRARIDFLVEAQIIQAEQSPSKRRNLRRAKERVQRSVKARMNMPSDLLDGINIE